MKMIYFKDFADITQVKSTVGSQLNSEDIVFDVPNSSTDYKDILTPISHYELTISDSKAHLKQNIFQMGIVHDRRYLDPSYNENETIIDSVSVSLSNNNNHTHDKYSCYIGWKIEANGSKYLINDNDNT
ncbi:hypothetical protein U3516DRAFT_790009 [Neocallimastix sp. 'constans']